MVWQLPVSPAIISSLYGSRIHPVTGNRTFHRGLDFAVAVGTTLRTPADGLVTVVGNEEGGAGKFITIDHSDRLQSRYFHLNEISVSKGQLVRAGQVIGKTGNTGLSTGPHLHLEIRERGGVGKAWENIDPLLYFPYTIPVTPKLAQSLGKDSVQGGPKSALTGMGIGTLAVGAVVLYMIMRD